MKGLYCGIDAGACATKVVLITPDRTVVATSLRRSGVNFRQAASECVDEVLKRAGVSLGDVRRTVATGYGRGNVASVDATCTEIACHGKAAWHYRGGPICVVDIGGQDSKVMHLDAQGRRTSFKMNRKCAAGTGAFLEEIALHLGVELDKMNEMALRSQGTVTLGSYCTVFTKTEVLTLVKRGERVEDIIKGAYDSVVKRILEMDSLENDVVMTGGVVAHNSIVVKLLEEKRGAGVYVPPLPQFAGAFGAALFALELEVEQNYLPGKAASF